MTEIRLEGRLRYAGEEKPELYLDNETLATVLGGLVAHEAMETEVGDPLSERPWEPLGEREAWALDGPMVVWLYADYGKVRITIEQDQPVRVGARRGRASGGTPGDDAPLRRRDRGVDRRSHDGPE